MNVVFSKKMRNWSRGYRRQISAKTRTFSHRVSIVRVWQDNAGSLILAWGLCSRYIYGNIETGFEPPNSCGICILILGFYLPSKEMRKFVKPRRSVICGIYIYTHTYICIYTYIYEDTNIYVYMCIYTHIGECPT